MDLWEAMRSRHSVRAYTDRPIEKETLAALQSEIDACNTESGLHIQMITDEPEAFSGFLAHYGKFSNVRNYIALVGQKSDNLEEQVGWYGERVVLRAQTLGLCTCWVKMSYRRNKCKASMCPGDELVCVISIGYGISQGTPHKSKPMNKLCRSDIPMPDWFNRGMTAALLAPTAVNQQSFRFTLTDAGVRAEATGGPCCHIDLGIVKYHFALGAGEEMLRWV